MTRPALLADRRVLDPLLAAGWRLAEGRDALCKTYVFADFAGAFGFMTQVALAAERMDHHPDWSNSYRRVSVELSTHSAGGLTKLDVALAARMDALAGG